MPTSKSHRRGPEEKNRRGKLTHKSSSFHGQSPFAIAEELRRPKTLPNLVPYQNVVGTPSQQEGRPRLTKLLLNVTIQGSLGPVQVVMTPESTVSDLITAAVRLYAKECRRPILPTTDPSMFDLHYSQFSLESVEVKAGQPLKVQPGEDKIIHLSQASLGESKNKGSESIPLFLKFGDQKLVLGTLSTENFPQLSFDLVFEKEFELSHNWKHGSVYFIGYKAITPEEEDHDEFDTDSEEEEMMEALPLKSVENGKAGPVITTQKAALKPELTGKQVKLVEPIKDDEDDDSSDEDEDEDEDEDDDEMSLELGDEDDDSDEEPEETPKKAELGKKRPSDSASKTPVPAKKAKSATPQKTDGKKSVHTATPHPSKKAGKTPASNEKSKVQTPKSGSQVSCKTCSKTFNSEVGLQSHTKAKHGGS